MSTIKEIKDELTIKKMEAELAALPDKIYDAWKLGLPANALRPLMERLDEERVRLVRRLNELKKDNK